MPKEPSIKVSVCMPVYQHEKYLREALDGVLSQQTTFSFEIVAGDDGSTDGTPKILREYAQNYPDKIRAFIHPVNLGPSSPKEFAGRNNVLFLLKECNGQYVALCEGDDYWTDPLKLQKQVDFMEANPEFSICHHNLEVIYEDSTPSHTFNSPDQKQISSITDLLEDKWFIGTASTLYRNYFLSQDFAPWHHAAASGDWALVLQIAAHGPIRFLPETMGVYRKHRGGLSNVQASTNLYFLRNRKEMFENVNQWLNGEYASIIDHTIKNYEERLVLLSKIENPR
jgi:glycosyltransferase involved in cell wall biosynthesis